MTAAVDRPTSPPTTPRRAVPSLSMWAALPHLLCCSRPLGPSPPPPPIFLASRQCRSPLRWCRAPTSTRSRHPYRQCRRAVRGGASSSSAATSRHRHQQHSMLRLTNAERAPPPPKARPPNEEGGNIPFQADGTFEWVNAARFEHPAALASSTSPHRPTLHLSLHRGADRQRGGRSFINSFR